MTSSTPVRATMEALEATRIVPVLRSPSAAECVATARDLVAAGLTVVEVTYSTPNAAEAIAELAAVPGCHVGAGTVLHPEQAAEAVAAGASFLVAPVSLQWFVGLAHELGVLAVPGAATPTEIHAAHTAGADLVKVFPIARLGGAAYIRDLLAPLPELRLMATGGVRADDVADLLRAGCVAVGLGSVHTDPSLGQSVKERGRAALAAATGHDQGPSRTHDGSNR